MIPPKTPRFQLPYLDPSQAQPEVKINEAWNIIDAALPGGSDVTSDSSDSGGGGTITVEDLADSPSTIIHNVSTLRFEGFTVESHTGGVAHIKNAAKSSGSVESAGWNSTSGPVQTAMSVPQDVLIPSACTLLEVYILTQGGSGSCAVNLWKANLSNHFPPTVTDDITGGTSPAIASSSTPYANSTLSGWTKSLALGDVIRCTLASNTGFTSVKIILRMG